MIALIATVGIVVSMPVADVFAAIQMNVKASATKPSVYEFNFTFDGVTPADSSLSIREYRIYPRNLTDGQGYENNRYITVPSTSSGQIVHPCELQADAGKIYTFQVKVVYNRSYIDGMGIPRVEEVVGAVIAEYAVLTNIEVDAVGEAGSMKVTWDYPSIGGSTPLFDGYNIYFANIENSTTTPLIWTRAENRTIPVNMLKFESGRATYTFSDPQLQVGRVYAVKIEPVIGVQERTALPGVISIGSHGNHYFRTDISKEYLTDKAYIKQNLIIEETSLTSIELTWESLVNKPLTGNISHIVVYSVDENGIAREVTRLSGTNPGRNTSVSIERPAKPTGYYVEVVYKDIQYQDISGTPVAKFDVVTQSIVAMYDPGAKEFAPYRPDIYEIRDNGATPFELSVTWKAFYRDAMNEMEKENVDDNGRFLDKDVTYEIAITDDPANFNFMSEVHSHIVDGTNMPIDYINANPYLRDRFTTYYQRNSSGAMEEKVIEQNKIYYVRVRAIRNATDEVSVDAIDSHYVMPINRIPVEPNIIAKPPLRVKTVNGIEVVDDSSITVEWDEQWIEIYNPADKAWYSKAALSGTTITYGDDVKDASNFLVNDRIVSSDGKINKISSLAKIKDTLSGLAPEYRVLRMVDISGAQYRVHVAQYDTIARYGYDDYFNEILRETTLMEWENIQPTSTNASTREYKVEKSHNPSESPLKEGTPYVVFIRPYFSTEQGDKLAYYPSYVTATTLINRGEMDITPTVPVLEAVPPAGDTTLTVRWRYVAALEYELRIDEAFKNYPAGGRVITNEDIVAKGTPKNDPVTGELYMYYTIDNLFPDTMYYIWTRSSANNTDGVVVSGWSNALEMRTAEIAPPPPPSGLGLASKQSLTLYNQENGTKLVSSDIGYFIVEWLRISADVNNTSGSAASGAAAGAQTQGTTTYLPNPLMPESYMVQINELIDNKNYHVRVKTRLLVTKNADGSSSRTYTYIAQLSADEGFVDYVEIEVPAVSNIAGGIYRDSEWVSVSLFSEKSDKEYDGDKNPEMYPLPDKDFEIIYDNATDTLTYRFRSNEKDKAGQDDNMVDERFISRLVANRTFEYKLDLSAYGTKIPKNRVIELPYTIVSAFNERKINLTVKAGDYTVTFPYDSFMTAEVKSLNNLNRTSKLKITIAENPEGIVDDGKTNYISATHKLSASLTTPAKTVNIVNFAKPLKMNLAISGQYVEGATNMGAHVQDGNTAGWQRLNSTFDTATKSMNFTSQRSANYSAIGLVTPWSQTQAATLNQMYAVNSKMAIKDLGYYNENADINIVQFNQLIAAALKGSATVEMNQPLSAADHSNLGKAKLLISGNGGSPVSREAGISAMVKLFEVKTRSPITGFPTIGETGYSDIDTADTQYRTAMLKAVELGFYRGANADPKGKLTFGDVMHMLDIILNY